MPRIVFAPHILRQVDCQQSEHAGRTVRECLERVFALTPNVRSSILDDQGSLRKHVVIYLNDRTVTDRECLTEAVEPNDEIFIFQALSGG
jgi:hypothetical protein